MPDWDDDSPALRRNLTKVLTGIGKRAKRRAVPTLEDARGWHSAMMQGLDVPTKACVGHFRGEKGIEGERAFVGIAEGAAPARVARELKQYERRLQKAVALLDARCKKRAELDSDLLAAVIDLSAWAHAEWVRIHPFINGNGRTARLWANSLYMRFGIPPVARLRPRPDGEYEAAATSAMRGDWIPTVSVFRRMLVDFLDAD